jgi:hypothetical protein
MDKLFQENKTGLVYAGMLGLWLSDVIPTGGDAIWFYYEKKWRDMWAKGELTAKQYWTRELFGYYFFNSTWWLMVGAAVYFTPGDYKKKLKIGILLAGAGTAIAIITKNIQKDEFEKLAEKNLAKQQLYDKTNGTTT